MTIHLQEDEGLGDACMQDVETQTSTVSGGFNLWTFSTDSTEPLLKTPSSTGHVQPSRQVHEDFGQVMDGLWFNDVKVLKDLSKNDLALFFWAANVPMLYGPQYSFVRRPRKAIASMIRSISFLYLIKLTVCT